MFLCLNLDTGNLDFLNTICLPLDTHAKASPWVDINFKNDYDAIIAGWGSTTKMGNDGLYNLHL